MSLARSNHCLMLLHRYLNAHNSRVSSVRHRHSVPRIPTMERQIVLRVTEPTYPKKWEKYPVTKTCSKVSRVERFNNPERVELEHILAGEFKQQVMKAKLIAVFHVLPCSDLEFYNQKVLFHRSNMKYLFHSSKMAKLAFTGTEYEPVLKLYTSITRTMICPEPDIKSLLKVSRKCESFVLMGAIVNGQMMSVADLKKYASLPPLPVLHGQFVGILSSPAQKLSSNLNYHQTELSSSLSRYISDQNKSDESN